MDIPPGPEGAEGAAVLLDDATAVAGVACCAGAVLTGGTLAAAPRAIEPLPRKGTAPRRAAVATFEGLRGTAAVVAEPVAGVPVTGEAGVVVWRVDGVATVLMEVLLVEVVGAEALEGEVIVVF